VDVDGVRDHPRHGPAGHAGLDAVDAGPGQGEVERLPPLPHRPAVAEEHDPRALRDAAARGDAEAREHGRVVAHRESPAGSALDREAEAPGGGERVEAEVEPAPAEGLEDGRAVGGGRRP